MALLTLTFLGYSPPGWLALLALIPRGLLDSLFPLLTSPSLWLWTPSGPVFCHPFSVALDPFGPALFRSFSGPLDPLGPTPSPRVSGLLFCLLGPVSLRASVLPAGIHLSCGLRLFQPLPGLQSPSPSPHLWTRTLPGFPLGSNVPFTGFLDLWAHWPCW